MSDKTEKIKEDGKFKKFWNNLKGEKHSNKNLDVDNKNKISRSKSISDGKIMSIKSQNNEDMKSHKGKEVKLIIKLENLNIEKSNICSMKSTFKKELGRFIEETPQDLLGDLKKQGSLWDENKQQFIQEDIVISKYLSEEQLKEIENGTIVSLNLIYKKNPQKNNKSPKLSIRVKESNVIEANRSKSTQFGSSIQIPVKRDRSFTVDGAKKFSTSNPSFKSLGEMSLNEIKGHDITENKVKLVIHIKNNMHEHYCSANSTFETEIEKMFKEDPHFHETKQGLDLWDENKQCFLDEETPIWKWLSEDQVKEIKEGNVSSLELFYVPTDNSFVKKKQVRISFENDTNNNSPLKETSNNSPLRDTNYSSPLRESLNTSFNNESGEKEKSPKLSVKKSITGKSALRQIFSRASTDSAFGKRTNRPVSLQIEKMSGLQLLSQFEVPKKGKEILLIIKMENQEDKSLFCPLNSTFKKELEKFLEDLPPNVSSETKKECAFWDETRKEYVPEEATISKYTSEEQRKKIKQGEVATLNLVCKRKDVVHKEMLSPKKEKELLSPKKDKEMLSPKKEKEKEMLSPKKEKEMLSPKKEMASSPPKIGYHLEDKIINLKPMRNSKTSPLTERLSFRNRSQTMFLDSFLQKDSFKPKKAKKIKLVIKLENLNIEKSNICSLKSTFKKELQKFIEETPSNLLGNLKKGGSLWDEHKQEFVYEDMVISKYLTEEQVRLLELNKEELVLTFVYKTNPHKVLANKSENDMDTLISSSELIRKKISGDGNMRNGTPRGKSQTLRSKKMLSNDSISPSVEDKFSTKNTNKGKEVKIVIKMENYHIEKANFVLISSNFKKVLQKFLEETPPNLLGEIKRDGSLFDEVKSEFVAEDVTLSNYLNEEQTKEIEKGKVVTLSFIYKKNLNNNNTNTNTNNPQQSPKNTNENTMEEKFKKLLLANKEGRQILNYVTKSDLQNSSNNKKLSFRSSSKLDKCSSVLDLDVLNFSINFFKKYPHSMKVEGIYRISANTQVVKMVWASFCVSKSDFFEKYFTEDSCHIVASSFKLYLRQIEEPVIPFEFYDEFIEVIRVHQELEDGILKLKTLHSDSSPISEVKEDSEEYTRLLKEHKLKLLDKTDQVLISKMQNLIKKLEPINQIALEQISTHLREVVDNSSSNKMNVNNIAVVFGPTLSRPREESVYSILDNNLNCSLVVVLIKHFESIFSINIASPPSSSNNNFDVTPTQSNTMPNLAENN